MNSQPRAGLLPLYLKLYDDCMPERRAQFEPFLKSAADTLSSAGMEVVPAPVCRLETEFNDAVRAFERADVDAIITLHLAYSPSLESIAALAGTELPIVILDTTMDLAFGRDVSPDRIMYNHGVHGVMDMANVLLRHGKKFEIAAGHLSDPGVAGAAAGLVRAARAAKLLRQTRALRIGASFHGMGDFAVDESVLRDVLGIDVVQAQPRDLAPFVEAVGRDEIDDELARDRSRFDCRLDEGVHARSVAVGLGLRRMLAERSCDAFSMNFLAFDDSAGPVNTVPFLEASKAMERGIGYAGEGDVLTAALVGALARGFGTPATFTEIFCPDWQGGSVFLSHMGEINPATASGKPLVVEKPFPYTAAENPAVLTCAMQPGPAVFVNLAPGPNDTFSLIAAPVTVLEDAADEKMKNSVRGWIKPQCALTDFLERYSLLGGTHHSALILGVSTEAVAAFARFAGLACHIIR